MEQAVTEVLDRVAQAIKDSMDYVRRSLTVPYEADGYYVTREAKLDALEELTWEIASKTGMTHDETHEFRAKALSE